VHQHSSDQSELFFKLDTEGNFFTKLPIPSDAISAQTQQQQQQQQYCGIFESAAPCAIHLRQDSTHVHILITRAPTCTRRLLPLLLTLLQARFHCYQNCGQWRQRLNNSQEGHSL